MEEEGREGEREMKYKCMISLTPFFLLFNIQI